MKTKFFKLKNKKNVVIITTLIVITLVLIFFAIYFITRYYKSLNRVEYDTKESSLYSYYTNIKYEYTGKVTLVRDGNITNIETSNDDTIQTNSIPIYYSEDTTSVILPQNMGLYLNNKKKLKTTYFAELSYDVANTGTQVYLKNNNKNIYIDKGFLYDGNDLYFFPYETKVVVDGITYELTPLSYVIACYRDQVEIYDRQNDKYIIIEKTKDDVIAYVDSLVINLTTDMVNYNEKDFSLLNKNIDALTSIQNQ